MSAVNKYKKYISVNTKLASEFIFDLLYPRFCLACGKYGYNLCINCYTKIDLHTTDTCFFCGKIRKKGLVCTSCRNKYKFVLRSLAWCGHYNDEILKETIHRFKYDGQMELGEILAEILYQRLLVWIKEEDYIVVPIPLHRSKTMTRGFNQAEILAVYISKKLNLRGGLALRRKKKTETQIKLDRNMRAENLAGSMECVDKDLVKGQKILLIDDVATTGATLNECAKVLLESGAKEVNAVVIARG